MKLIYDTRQLPAYLTVAETAILLRLSQETIKKHCQQKRFPCFKVGKEWRIDKRKLVEQLESVGQA